MSRTYANVTEFAAWLGEEEAPPGAARLLRDASLDVDDMLLTAIYNVDVDDMPTDPKVIEALRDATCAQAQHRDEFGTDADMIADSAAVSLGPLSFGVGRGSGQGAQSTPVYSPAALRVLRVAGLIPGGVTDG